MAEIEGSTAILPSASEGLGATVQGDAGRYLIRVSEFSPSGKKEEFAVALPTDARWGNVLLRAALLKRTTWDKFPMPTIIHAVVYADQAGLDIMAGDVYMAQEGRYSTTAGAKVRHAMSTGLVEGMEITTVEGPAITIPFTTKGTQETWKGPNYETTVTLDVRGWKKPFVYKATLKEWFEGRNPNWRNRPVYMLEQNALGKACERVAPMGVEADEAPPVDRGLTAREVTMNEDFFNQPIPMSKRSAP